jgi:23S rRNA pseudouridine1911/1915/1917 synthase
MLKPFILDESPDYLVAYKPPLMHSVPLKPRPERSPEGDRGETLLDWCAALRPELRGVHGKRDWEGAALHRLDYETSGLVLLARRQEAMEALLAQQEAGLFVKEYEALSAGERAGPPLPGFPPAPPFPAVPGYIESAFRPFGPGGKAVRPAAVTGAVFPAGAGKKAALDRGRPYRTEFLGREDAGGCCLFRLRINRGFRHQIRCHLAWIGRPLLNDGLYGGMRGELPPGAGPASGGFTLGLCARQITFLDPSSGEERSYRV